MAAPGAASWACAASQGRVACTPRCLLVLHPRSSPRGWAASRVGLEQGDQAAAGRALILSGWVGSTAVLPCETVCVCASGGGFKGSAPVGRARAPCAAARDPPSTPAHSLLPLPPPAASAAGFNRQGIPAGCGLSAGCLPHSFDHSHAPRSLHGRPTPLGRWWCVGGGDANTASRSGGAAGACAATAVGTSGRRRGRCTWRGGQLVGGAAARLSPPLLGAATPSDPPLPDGEVWEAERGVGSRTLLLAAAARPSPAASVPRHLRGALG